MLKKIIYGLIILLLLLLITFVAVFYNTARQSALIVNAGLQNNLLQDCPDRPSCVNSLSNVDEHAIAAFSVSANMIDPIGVMADLIRSLPRTEILEQNDAYLHAKFTSAVFGFNDDLEILRDGSQLQVRSVSRVGFSDMGVNRKRVEDIRKLWQQ